MADFMYDNYREEALKGIRDVSTEVIKVMAVTLTQAFWVMSTTMERQEPERPEML